MKFHSVAFAIVALFFLSSCGKKLNTEFTKECNIPSDQSKTITGHWPSAPIPIAVEPVDFSASEIQRLGEAVTTWNTFYGASKSMQIYNAGSSSFNTQTTSPRITAATVCSTPMVTPSGFSRKIMIYKVSSSWTYGSTAIAVTSTCPTVSSGQFKTITAANMEINYVNYFSSGKPQPDLTSIVLHELGHLVGLGHSCGNLSNGTSVSCKPEYVEAAMYPSLGFVGLVGQVKRDLTTNDQERANCLY